MNKVKGAWDLAQLMQRSALLSYEYTLFVTIIEADETGVDVERVATGWIGEPENTIREAYNTHEAELVLYNGTPKELYWFEDNRKESMFPISVVRDGRWIVAVGGNDERVNKFIAAILMWYLLSDTLVLHHHGTTHVSAESRDDAVRKAEKEYKTYAVELRAEGHDRHFIGMPGDDDLEMACYIEESHWDKEDEREVSYHWDFYAGDEAWHFLFFLGQQLGIQPDFWSFEDNSPVGMVEIRFDRRPPIQAMARIDNTPPPTWLPI